MDMEIEVLQNIRLEMQNDTNFIRMKNLRSFEEVRQYILKDFANYFKAQTKTFVLASDAYIFFRSNNCVVSDKYQYDNMESIFNEHIIMEGMDWNQFRNSLFEKKSKFDARYEDLYRRRKTAVFGCKSFTNSKHPISRRLFLYGYIV